MLPSFLIFMNSKYKGSWLNWILLCVFMFQNGLELYASERIVLEVTEDEALLVNHCAHREDAGMYMVRLQNEIGVDSANMKLSVVGK